MEVDMPPQTQDLGKMFVGSTGSGKKMLMATTSALKDHSIAESTSQRFVGRVLLFPCPHHLAILGTVISLDSCFYG